MATSCVINNYSLKCNYPWETSLKNVHVEKRELKHITAIDFRMTLGNLYQVPTGKRLSSNVWGIQDYLWHSKTPF